MALNKIAIVIPTVGRLAELCRMLQSLADQTRLPDQVIVIDEAGEGKTLPAQFPCLNISVTTFAKGSASAKRNLGVQHITPEIPLIGFMDDDIVLEKPALEIMMNFWQEAPPELGGVSFNLVNHAPAFAPWLKSLKLAYLLSLYDARAGIVLPSGFHTRIIYVLETQYVDWLPTTAAVFRRPVLAGYSFDEWYEGYSYLEDLDLSYSIGRKYKLAVLAGARFWHYPSAIGRTDWYSFGRMEMMNRFHFVQKHRELSPARCFFALTFRSLISLFVGLTEFKRDHFKRWWGNVAGLTSIVMRRAEHPAR